MVKKAPEANPPKPRRPRKKPTPTDGSPMDAIDQTQSVSALEKMMGAKKAPTDIKEIAHAFYSEVKGSAGFVKMIMEEYKGCPVGSLARMRILHLMKELFRIATPKDRLGDMSLINDDDLARVWNEQLDKNQKSELFKQQLPVDPFWVYHFCI